MLTQGELCVSQIADILEDSLSAVSQRLKLLRSERIVSSRRAGKHVFYALADQHVSDLVSNALRAHQRAGRRPARESFQLEEFVMSGKHTHAGHTHEHGAKCGHTAIEHDGHTDYLHDGHLHHPCGNGKVEEHVIAITPANPDVCNPVQVCGHATSHQHGAGCGHEAVPHGDHIDYLVDGHLHHPHNSHCDDHGKVDVKP